MTFRIKRYDEKHQPLRHRGRIRQVTSFDIRRKCSTDARRNCKGSRTNSSRARDCSLSRGC